MIGKKPARKSHSALATYDDLIQAFGDLDATKAVAVLALKPTLAELEEAVMRLADEEEDLASNPRQPKGIVAEILNILAVEEDEQRQGRS